MSYFNKARNLSFFWLFGIEGPAAACLIYYVFSTIPAECPASATARMVWILQRIFLAIIPSFNFLWGAMRAFDTDTKAEDPFAGVESLRWKTFQNILTNNTEQCIMFIPTMVSLAMIVPCDMWAAVPTFLYVFVAGRILFAVGYFVPPFPGNPFAPLFTLPGWARSPGMNLSLYPLTFALSLCMYYMYTGTAETFDASPPKKFGFV